MHPLLRRLWPLLLGIVLFIVISQVVRTHLADILPYLRERTGASGMALFVLLGIVTVVVPFGSLLPFMPLGVEMWGWRTTGGLTLLSWILGSQLLFELARHLGKRIVLRVIPAGQAAHIRSLVHDKGLVHALIVRMTVHGDITSYAYGMFTDIGRWEFLAVTAVGVAPGAFLYAYFGSMPLAWQVTLALLGLSAVTAYWIIERKRPQWLRFLRKLDVQTGGE